jgi:ribosomal protein L15
MTEAEEETTTEKRKKKKGARPERCSLKWITTDEKSGEEKTEGEGGKGEEPDKQQKKYSKKGPENELEEDH